MQTWTQNICVNVQHHFNMPANVTSVLFDAAINFQKSLPALCLWLEALILFFSGQKHQGIRPLFLLSKCQGYAWLRLNKPEVIQGKVVPTTPRTHIFWLVLQQNQPCALTDIFSPTSALWKCKSKPSDGCSQSWLVKDYRTGPTYWSSHTHQSHTHTRVHAWTFTVKVFVLFPLSSTSSYDHRL